MDIFIPGSSAILDRPTGRDTELTQATMDEWAPLVPAAPEWFADGSDSVEVSPPVHLFKPGGLNFQDIGMCVGKAKANQGATVQRIPEGAEWDPKNPDVVPERGPNVRFSGLFDYWNARNINGRSSFREGAIVAYAFAAGQKFGYLPYAEYPDTRANQAAYSDRNRPSPKMYEIALGNVVVEGYRILTRKAYFDWLAAGYPVADGVPCHSGWFNTAEDGKFSLGGALKGGHATVTTQYDRKRNRLVKLNSWPQWGYRHDDPEDNSNDPAFFGNAGGFSNVGYCPLDEYEDRNLTDRAFQTGQTDAFVVVRLKAGRPEPLIKLISHVDIL